MKIAIDGSILWGRYSGVEKVADRVIRRLLENPRGHEIRVFLPADWPGFEGDTVPTSPVRPSSFILHPSDAPGAPSFVLRPSSSVSHTHTLKHSSSLLPFPGSHRLRRIFWQQVELPWILWRWRADVVFCPAYVMPLFSPCPAVAFVHDLHGLRFHQTRLENYVHYRLLLPPTLRRARTIITPTQTVGDEVIGRCGGRVLVAPLGVDPWFTPANERQSEPGAVPYILFVGNLEERKGLRLLIEACATLFARQPNLTLLLAGKDRGLQPQLVEMAARLGISERVRFLGYVETGRLVELYRGAAVLAQPSTVEGFGIPPLEAMACGTPVVGVNSPALKENLEGAALLVEGSAGSFAAALEQVLTDPTLHARLRATGLERARNFTWDRTTSTVWDAIEGAENGGR